MSESVAFQDVVNSKYVRKTFSYWSASKHDCACTPFCWQLKCSNTENKCLFDQGQIQDLRGVAEAIHVVLPLYPGWELADFYICCGVVLVGCSGTWWPPLVPAEQFPHVFKDIKYDDSCRIKTAGIPDCTNTWKMFMVSDLQKHSFQRTISTSILRAYQKWLNGIHQSALSCLCLDNWIHKVHGGWIWGTGKAIYAALILWLSI